MSEPIIVDGMRGGVCYDSFFPENDASEIIKWAVKTGNSEAEQLVDEIRKWLGAPNDVMVLAEIWSPGASSLVGDAKQGMSTALADTKAYWEGPAFEAYEDYNSHVTGVIDEVSALLNEMSGLLLTCRETITATYQAAIKFIGECAAILLEKAGSVLQNWKDLWGGVCGAILSALADFVRAVTQLASDTADILGRHDAAALLLKQKAAELTVPDPMAEAAGEAGNWDVRETD